MKKVLIQSLLVAVIAFQIVAQQKVLVPYSDESVIEMELVSKVASSEVFEQIREKKHLKQLNPTIQNEKVDYIFLTVYFAEKPSEGELAQIENTGVEFFVESWIPPMQNHPYGFIIAKVPVDKVNTLLTESSVIKVGSAETISEPNNNRGTASIKANLLWNEGFTGNGVKVAVLDSGLDTEPLNSDLPSTIEKRDYSNYPTSIDNNVENMVSGHGTHVTGSVLGRGILSSSNTINGGGSYKGSAPNADLLFLKIGGDVSSNTTGASIMAAIKSAVDTFDADIITMSYGGWYAHHDGSSPEEQTVDWAYSQGVPVFMSAGNEGNNGRHYSGTVSANSETDFIRVNVTNAGINNTALFFNLVWSDGTARNNLTLNYYNSSFAPLGSITTEPTTESFRGTESQFSNYGFYALSGNSTFYLKVVNSSNVDQPFHIYDRWGARVSFQTPDPFYTIGQPASADNCIAVGAYTSSTSWTNYAGSNINFSIVGLLNDISYFSSRGPRIDGLVKPNITAPGSAIISMRDRDVLFTPNNFWVDNDGIVGGNANYYVMQGTSMATPITAGAVALLMQKYPGLTPLQIYNAIKDNALSDSFTGSVPNNTWGYGKLDIYEAAMEDPLPVELESFSAVRIGSMVKLNWSTSTEINNYGFEIERGNLISLGNKIWNNIGFVEGNGNSNSLKNYSFEDKNLFADKYVYRLKQIDNDGQYEYSNEVEIDLGIPSKFELMQNYPNPFNPITKINFSLPIAKFVSIKIFNSVGELVKTLSEKDMTEGYHSIEWDATNDYGNKLSSGMYLYRIQAGNFVETKKMILLK
jgi:subtilisin family serine protease